MTHPKAATFLLGLNLGAVVHFVAAVVASRISQHVANKRRHA